MAEHVAASNSEHEHASQTGARGGHERLEDLEDFNRWLEATAKGDSTLASPKVIVSSRSSIRR